MAAVTQEDIEKMSPEELLEMQKQNCIFCKIIAGDIPSKKVHEDKEFIAILDINPASKGHVLIMPKQHIQILPQMSPEMVGKLGNFTKEVSQKLISALSVKGTTVFVANGAVAGQKAPHFMLHVIPRTNSDDLPLNPRFIDVSKSHKKLREKLTIALTGKPPGNKLSQKDGSEEEAEDVSGIEEDQKTPEGEAKTEPEKNNETEDKDKDKDKEDNEGDSTNSEIDLDAISKYING